MEKWAATRLKWLLILEIFFAGIYLALTRGLFVILLVSRGFGLEGISLAVLTSATAATVASTLIYKRPEFIVHKVKLKFAFFHGFERFLWILLPLTADFQIVLLIYTFIMALPVSTFSNLAVYGSFNEEDIKDLTAKRSAAFGVSSVMGFTLAVLLVALIPSEDKYFLIFLLGSVIGLVSTMMVALMNLSHLEGVEIPKGIEQPEKVFSTSSFFIAILASGNLLAIVWTPYVMNRLGAADFIAVSLSLAGTLASVAASLVWRGRSFKGLRTGLTLDALAPFLAWMTPLPILHIPLFAYSSFTYTASNFLGNFLFARYNKWLGAIKSSVLMVIVGSAAQMIVAPIGMFAKGDYFLLFSVIIGVKAISILLAFITIPEVAVIPEQCARTYSFILYSNSVIGYRVAVELSRETILTTLRLLALSLILLILYFIYRVLIFMIG